MKKLVYRLYQTLYKTDDGTELTAYGIAAEKLKNGKFKKVADVPDLFFEYDKAKLLVDMCNSLDISLIHLADVIEDELP